MDAADKLAIVFRLALMIAIADNTDLRAPTKGQLTDET